MNRVCLSVMLFVISILYHPLTIDANDERDALIAFKNAITDDPQNNLESWDPTLVNPCTWFHVTCNNTKVTRVDAGGKGLSGHLVPELGNLAKLQYLELYDNNLDGPIPPELGKLTDFVSLDLYKNKLSGPIPDMLGNLAGLKYLRLTDNNLSGPIPDNLAPIAGRGVLQSLSVLIRHARDATCVINQ